MGKIGAIVCARVKSSRIPEKVLQKINGKHTIEILLDNIIPEDDRYQVILAIPENSDDDILQEIAEKKGVEVYRGQDDSPMHRLYECAKLKGFQHIVRITADDILIDQNLLRNQINMHIKGRQEYTFMRKCPEGTATEIIDFNALEDAVKKRGSEPAEFISYYLKNVYKTFEYYPPKEYQKFYRLVMDFPEDLMLLRILFASLPEPVGILDIIHFLSKHTYLLSINRLPSITVYTCNYNTEKYIIETMESVLNQTMSDYEYIILDDNSSDNSLKKIVEYYSEISDEKKKKIKLLKNKENIGLPASCNKVIKMAKGRYVVRVDSDDIINQDFLKNMLFEIKKADVHCIFSGFNRFDENKKNVEVCVDNPFHPGCSVLARWALNELKYKENLEFMEGKEFFERFRDKYKWGKTDKILWNYRIRDGQKTKDKNHPDNKGDELRWIYSSEFKIPKTLEKEG